MERAVERTTFGEDFRERASEDHLHISNLVSRHTSYRKAVPCYGYFDFQRYALLKERFNSDWLRNQVLVESLTATQIPCFACRDGEPLEGTKTSVKVKPKLVFGKQSTWPKDGRSRSFSLDFFLTVATLYFLEMTTKIIHICN